MHGLVNRAIQCFIRDSYGQTEWEAICRAAGADLGGVEYLLREESGSPCFYDFNPYSNFVSGGKEMFGFSISHLNDSKNFENNFLQR